MLTKRMIQEYLPPNAEIWVQQYDTIKDSAVRGAMIGNSNELPKLNPIALANVSRADLNSVS